MNFPNGGNTDDGDALNSTQRGFPLTLEINSNALPKQSWIKISQIRTLATERIGAKIAEATPDEVAQTVAGLSEILG